MTKGRVKMKVEVLYFDGCPSYTTAAEVLEGIIFEEELAAHVELVAVNTEKEAQQLRFPGSPTIRVDGRDLFPAEEREDWQLGCRVYATPEGLRGWPTKEMMRKALIG